MHKTADPLLFLVVVVAGMLLAAQTARAVDPAPPAYETVEAIKPPRLPLPPEGESAAVTRFSFLVYGDTRGRRDGKAEQYEHSLVIDSMLQQIHQLSKTPFPVRFVLQTGDAVVKGTDPRQWNASFVHLINRLTTEAGVPYYLVPGNHDVTSASELDAPDRRPGLANYLAAVTHLLPPDNTARRLSGYPTYAFGYGNTFVIAFDSNIAADDTQFAWVREQVAGLDRKRYQHLIAFFHHPAFSSGPHGAAKLEPAAGEVRKRYMPFFREHGFEVLFTGHEHFFEHWVERYEAGGKTRRLDQIVTGGGGAPLYGYMGEPDLRDYLKTYAAAKVRLSHPVKPGPNPGDNPYHYVIVQVDGDRLSLQVVGVDWGKNFAPYSSSRSVLEDDADNFK